MFSPEAADAVKALQTRASKTTDAYTLERIDRALDEITRHPEKSEPAAFQIRSAMANAAKVMANRRALAPCTPIDDRGAEPGYLESGYHSVELMCWLGAVSLPDSSRALLAALAYGEDAASLAAVGGIDVRRMRERVSRARRAALPLYTAAA